MSDETDSSRDPVLRSENRSETLPLGSFVDERFRLPDARTLQCYCWPAESEPRGILVFAHGMLEHAGRYADWGEQIARYGYTTYAVDHYGHGRSDGNPQQMNTVGDFVEDFLIFTRSVKDRHPDKPLFVVGMSMGGGIALRTAVRIQNDKKSVAGLILVAAALKVSPKIFPFLRPFADLFDWIAPNVRLVRAGVGGLSRDPAVRRDFLADPYTWTERFRLHYGVENLRAVKTNRALAPEVALPILILQGTGDRIIDPRGAEEFFAALGPIDKTLRLYPGLYHDILHESAKEKITAEIAEWLDLRTPD